MSVPTPNLTAERLTVLTGDCREQMRTLEPASVQCCVTSPPYWGLRDYGHAGQIGQEKTPQEFVAAMVEVFREVWRVLKPDGTCWLNLGDSYCSQGGSHDGRTGNQCGAANVGAKQIWRNGSGRASGNRTHKAVSEYERSDSDEHRTKAGLLDVAGKAYETRNKRSVWTVGTFSYRDAHFATFPPDLIKPCILAGSRAGDMILDPFGGSGTTGEVALQLGRSAVLIELNPEYIPLIHQRAETTLGLAL